MSANDLAEQNTDLVHYIAKKYKRVAQSRGESFEDIMGAGYLGLVKASRNFNPELGFQFSTYASNLIRGSILNHFRDNVSPIRVPRLERELAIKIFRNNLQDKTPEKIAAALGRNIGQVTKALESNSANVVLHLQVKNPADEELTLEDSIPVEADFTSVYVSEFLKQLSPRQLRVLALRMNGKSQGEIGKVIGYKQMTISRDLKEIGQLFLDYQEGKEFRERGKVC